MNVSIKATIFTMQAAEHEPEQASTAKRSKGTHFIVFIIDFSSIFSFSHELYALKSILYFVASFISIHSTVAFVRRYYRDKL